MNKSIQFIIIIVIGLVIIIIISISISIICHYHYNNNNNILLLLLLLLLLYCGISSLKGLHCLVNHPWGQVDFLKAPKESLRLSP